MTLSPGAKVQPKRSQHAAHGQRAQRTYRSDEPDQGAVRGLPEHAGARAEDSLEHYRAGRTRHSDDDVAYTPEARLGRADARDVMEKAR